MFSIIKMSPRSEDYLLDLVEYYFRSKARKKKRKRKGLNGNGTDDDNSPDVDPDDDGMGLADAEPYNLDMPGEPPGKWFGKGAAKLGLTGMIHEEPYRRIFRGLHPFTGEPLVQNANMPDRRPGWDGCQSAVKDLSVLTFGASEERRNELLETYADVTEAVVTMIEERFAFSRVGKAAEGCRYARGGLVVGIWEARQFQGRRRGLAQPHSDFQSYRGRRWKRQSTRRSSHIHQPTPDHRLGTSENSMGSTYEVRPHGRGPQVHLHYPRYPAGTGQSEVETP